MNKRYKIVSLKHDWNCCDIQDTAQKIPTFYNDLGAIWSVEPVCDLLNLYDKEYKQCHADVLRLEQEKEDLIKQIHLIHMSAMFSTVKSFKGDVSSRYKYDEKTDTVYDTANKYGQYSKILDKKEIVMLLNEYNTLLEEGES